MRVEKLFNVLVLAGMGTAASAIVGCGDDSTGTGHQPSTGSGGSGTGGSSNGGSSNGGKGGSGNTCDTKCGPSPDLAAWTECGGCCCWLAVDAPAPAPGLKPGCGQEPCCAGLGPGR